MKFIVYNLQWNSLLIIYNEINYLLFIKKFIIYNFQRNLLFLIYNEIHYL